MLRLPGMENVRLIYEQIEEARRHLVDGSLLHLGLALILLDNAAELMMYRELEYETASWSMNLHGTTNGSRSGSPRVANGSDRH